MGIQNPYDPMSIEVSPDVLAKAADTLYSAAPWLVESSEPIDEILQSMFPRASADSFHQRISDGKILCLPVYFTVRYPRSYPTKTCICCLLCKKVVNGIGYHLIERPIDYCERCFLADKSRTFEQYLCLLAAERAHPFVQDKKTFPLRVVDQAEQLAKNPEYLTKLTRECKERQERLRAEFKQRNSE